MQRVYQQTPTTVVVVQQPAWYRGPTYLNSGVRVCGIALSLPIIIFLGLAGVMFIFSGITTISMGANTRFHFDDDDDDPNPNAVVGSILLIVGVVLIGGCIALGCYSKKQYNRLGEGLPTDNPGRVINRSPSPSPQHVVQPGGIIGPQPMGGQPSSGYLLPGGQVAYPANIVQTSGQMPYPAPAGQMAYPAPVGHMAYPAHGGQNYTQPTPYGAGPSYPPGAFEKVVPPPYSTHEPGSQAMVPNQNTSASTQQSSSEYSAPPPYAPDYKGPM